MSSSASFKQHDGQPRVSGLRLGGGGTVLPLDACAVEITDPDDPDRIIVVPLTAVRLLFHAGVKEPGPASPR